MACTIDCTVFFAKALACQNIDHFNIPTTIPTIGLDPKLDACLCQDSVLSSMHTCASCRASNTNGTDVTNTFISACNTEFPGRNLALPSSATPSVTAVAAANKKLVTGLPILVAVFLTCAHIIVG